jgi:hypothetical protein
MSPAADFEAKVAVGRHRPEKGRLGRKAELMARMVLGKAAIRVGVRSAPGTGAQIRDQFVQLDRSPSHLHPDQSLAGRQFDEQIKLARRRVMLRFSWLEGDVIPEPATLKNKPGGGGELAKIFPKEPPVFVGHDSVRRRGIVGPAGRQECAFHMTLGVNREKVFVYSAAKKFVFPLGQRRADPKSGLELRLQPGFELGVQRGMEGSCNLSCCRASLAGV